MDNNNVNADNQQNPAILNSAQHLFDVDPRVMCTICFEKGCDFQTTCRHIFHSKCIALWRKKNEKCPNC